MKTGHVRAMALYRSTHYYYKRNLINILLFVYSMFYGTVPSHFSWQAQLDARFSPALRDEISDIPFT